MENLSAFSSKALSQEERAACCHGPLAAVKIFTPPPEPDSGPRSRPAAAINFRPRPAKGYSSAGAPTNPRAGYLRPSRLSYATVPCKTAAAYLTQFCDKYTLHG